MKLKMLIGLAGPLYALSPGDEWEFPEEEARRLVGAEFAIEVGATETADASPRGERRTKKGKSDVVPTEGDDSAVGGADIAGRGEAAS
ncbi:conserved protein of unknown function [Aminobacter niigataensis]|nr:conserved protein of unknown function [Aminobacter niigataensis]